MLPSACDVWLRTCPDTVGAATARAWKLEDAKSDGSSDGSSDESDDGAAPTNYHLAGVASPRSNKLSCV